MTLTLTPTCRITQRGGLIYVLNAVHYKSRTPIRRAPCCFVHALVESDEDSGT